MSSDDEVLEFDFEGVNPAVFTSFVAMPKGEYNLQCIGLRKYFKGDEGGKKDGDTDKPGLEFTFSVTTHPSFSGRELKIWHPFGESSRQFLLNTLMCVIPGPDWQQNGIKVPISQLKEQAAGRPCNGLVDWEITTGTNKNVGKRFVNSSLKSLKPFDPSITQPVATEGNPPVIDNSQSSVSATTQAAASGVPSDEVNAFLNSIPGSSPTTNTPATGGSVLDFGF